MELTMLYYIIPSLIMFCCGVYGFITRKNMIAILISLELMLNAVDINFVVFNMIHNIIYKRGTCIKHYLLISLSVF